MPSWLSKELTMTRLASKRHCLQTRNAFQSFSLDNRLLPSSRSQSMSYYRQLSACSSRKSPNHSDISMPSLVYPHRPFTFHIATSWAGKPSMGDDRVTDDQPFPLESPIGRWREVMLDRDIGLKKKRRGKDWVQDAGEDFFYVQEVCKLHYISWLSIDLPSQMRNGSVGMRSLTAVSVWSYSMCAHDLSGCSVRSCRRGWRVDRKRSQSCIILAVLNVSRTSIFTKCLGRRTRD